MKLLLDAFHAYLVDQKQKEINLRKRIEKRFGITGVKSNSISWIETLLQTPVDDYRKNAIGLILAPYLINIKKLPYYQQRSNPTESIVTAGPINRCLGFLS